MRIYLRLKGSLSMRPRAGIESASPSIDSGRPELRRNGSEIRSLSATLDELLERLRRLESDETIESRISEGVVRRDEIDAAQMRHLFENLENRLLSTFGVGIVGGEPPTKVSSMTVGVILDVVVRHV